MKTPCFKKTIADHHVQQVLSRKAGVLTGDDVFKLFQHAKDNGYAIPAINVGHSKYSI